MKISKAHRVGFATRAAWKNFRADFTPLPSREGSACDELPSGLSLRVEDSRVGEGRAVEKSRRHRSSRKEHSWMLGKRYGDVASHAFINAILDAIAKDA